MIGRISVYKLFSVLLVLSAVLLCSLFCLHNSLTLAHPLPPTYLRRQACLDKLLGGEGDSTSSAAKSKEAEEQARIAALYETEGDCAPAELDDLELDEETLKKNADDLAQQEKDKKGKKAKQKQARAEKAAEAKGANEDTRSDKKAVKERARQKKADGEKERRKQKAAANGGKDDEE